MYARVSLHRRVGRDGRSRPWPILAIAMGETRSSACAPRRCSFHATRPYGTSVIRSAVEEPATSRHLAYTSSAEDIGHSACSLGFKSIISGERLAGYPRVALGSGGAVDNSGLARRQLTPLEPLVKRIEAADVLDPPAKIVGRTVRDLLSREPLKDVLSGSWLGHALHPMLTDVVIGSFMSATLLDLLGGDRSGAAQRRLITLGVVAYAPTALAGINDWADTETVDDGVRRAGFVHAGTNLVALTLYSISLRARSRGATRSGALFGALGAGVLAGGGYLGGHLSLTKGVGPNQTVFDPGPSDWIVAADASQLPDGRPTRVVVDDTPVLLLRRDEYIFAIHDRCSHRGCSLTEGEIEGDEVVCACHGSRFSVRDGALQRGPATMPQPAFQVRLRDDQRIEIRRLSDPP
jgi:nitrite reductase/ring-hydroxylating ferredoxin subunit